MEYCSLVISSTDTSSHLWGLYSIFHKKYWSNCPFKIYLLNEKEKLYENSSVFNIQILNDEKHWSNMLLASLKTINSKYVILNFEDQIPIMNVINSKIIDTLKFMDQNSVGLVQIWQNNFHFLRNKLKFIKIPFGTPYRMSCSTGIWNKDFLINCLKPNESPWKFEKEGSFREFSNKLQVYKTNHSLFRYLNVQRKGKIRYKARKIFIHFFKNNNDNNKLPNVQFQSQLNFYYEQIISILIYFFNLLHSIFKKNEK